MGCDIHCYLEYRKDATDRWNSFGGQINPGRNYEAFGFLAGVRRDGPPIVEPRGFVKDYGYYASQDYWCWVTEYEGDGNVKPETANRWVEDQSSRWRTQDDGTRMNWVSNPDWHTHSWMTPDEWEEAISSARKEYSWTMPEYDAITAALKSLQQHGEARIVFWFDN